ncbi:hypothetical protein [Kitasatospora sp. NPDC047058]|uniref:hypothetical protein n=1 Tax=Kitasatospora sp. NPDC047058 TaxID=3155620 RepID=UPI0033DE56EF
MTDSQTNGGRGRRRLRLVAGVAVVLAAAVTGAVLVLGGGEPGLKQTLCGLQRADGTPLDRLLPKEHPGTEQREVRGEGQVSCKISVDGEQALSISLIRVDADKPDDNGRSPKGLIGRGPLASGPGAGVTEYCADDHSKAVMVTVITDTFPRNAADRDASTKALGSLAEKVVAEQQRDVCH